MPLVLLWQNGCKNMISDPRINPKIVFRISHAAFFDCKERLYCLANESVNGKDISKESPFFIVKLIDNPPNSSCTMV